MAGKVRTDAQQLLILHIPSETVCELHCKTRSSLMYLEGNNDLKCEDLVS